MKMNWGAGIAALYAGFVAMILLLVGMSAGQKIDLVTDHYYEEELKFQGKIDKRERADTLAEPLSWEVANGGLQIHYPTAFADSAITGEIRLYCPSDNRNDRKFAIRPEQHMQALPGEKIPAGRYKVQADWRVGETTYWNEGVVVIAGAAH